MARILLVHGAFAGAWVWEPVLPGLHAAGHTVASIDLPGSGDDVTPVIEVTLDAYAERICGALVEGEPAVLVGQSMGGIAITQAAARCPGQIASLVYAGAFLPAAGQSLTDLVAYPEAADDQVQANLIVQGDPPVAILAPEATGHALCNCCTAEQASWVAQRLGPQPLAVFGMPVTVDDANREGFECLSRAYIVCAQDRAIPPAMQRRMLTEIGCDPVIEIAADHMPWVSRTEEFVEALDRIVQAGSPAPA